MFHRERRWILGLGSLCMLSGCASIGLRPAGTSDESAPSKTFDKPQDGVHAVVTQDETEITVRARHLCSRINEPVVNRTFIQERYNKSPSTDYALAGAGAVAVIGGLAYVVDAQNVHADDKTSREYNSTGPQDARLAGYSLIGVGSVLLGVAAVDALRATGEERHTEGKALDPVIKKRGVPCSPYDKARVRLEFLARSTDALGKDASPRAVDLGTTDSSGVFETDLADGAIPKDLVLDASKLTATILVEDTTGGEVDLRELFRERRKAAWKGTDMNECRNATGSQSCRDVRKFVALYPTGRYTEAAKALLDEMAPRLRGLRDDETFRTARDHLKDCSEKKYEYSSEIRDACKPLRRYVQDFPDGKHIKVVKEALAKGERREAALDKKLEAQVEKEALAEERKRLAHEREIERRRKARQRKREAEARKRRQKLVRICRGECKVICSRRHRRYNSCYQGCVEARCTDLGDGQ